MDQHIQELESKIGYCFKEKVLIQNMLTHPSLLKKRRAHDFERLEFLGDRVLGLTLADWLYRNCPQDPEGTLSKRHSYYVGRQTLNQIAEHLELKKFLRFDQDSQQKRHTIFSDACEALIGAIYLDGGFGPAQAFILKMWAALLRDKTVSFTDPKSALQEWSQSHKKGLPIYEVIQTKGPDHNRIFTVSVLIKDQKPFYGSGPSKQAAEKQAAEKCLLALTDQ